MKKIVSFLGDEPSRERAEAFLAGMVLHGFTEAPYERDECSVMVVWGERPETLVERLWRATEGLPTVVLDLGFMGRADLRGSAEGYFQACIGGLCRFPDVVVPSDRFDALCLNVEDDHELTGRWMIAAQVANDTQHHQTGEQLEKFYLDLVRSASLYHAKSVVFRKHPKAPIADYPTLRKMIPFEDGNEIPLSEALSACAGVLTYNSTLFYEATMKGIPVVCHPLAPYVPIATPLRCPLRLRSAKEKLPFLHRVAYSQWTMDEMRRGISVAFLLPHL